MPLVTSISAEQVNRLLDEAAQADIVTALGHGRYRFSHALIREALYDRDGHQQPPSTASQDRRSDGGDP